MSQVGCYALRQVPISGRPEIGGRKSNDVGLVSHAARLLCRPLMPTDVKSICRRIAAVGIVIGVAVAAPVVPVGNLRSEILVVQSAQNWHRQRATDGLNGTRDRRVLVQRWVRPSLVVIALVGIIEQMAQMPFAEHNNMLKTIPSDRTDEPLRISVLPW